MSIIKIFKDITEKSRRSFLCSSGFVIAQFSLPTEMVAAIMMRVTADEFL